MVRFLVVLGANVLEIVGQIVKFFLYGCVFCGINESLISHICRNMFFVQLPRTFSHLICSGSYERGSWIQLFFWTRSSWLWKKQKHCYETKPRAIHSHHQSCFSNKFLGKIVFVFELNQIRNPSPTKPEGLPGNII